MIERVVVTGAAGGIGSACVGAFQALGCHVVGVDRRPASGADDHLSLDIGDPRCGEVLLDHLRGRRVDALINNAAVPLDKEAADVDPEEFDRVMAVNLRAPFLVARALHPTLRSHRGSVVNVASVHAVATSPKVSVYAASKGGLVAMTRALAVEWAPEVRVNAVLPGAVATGMLDEGMSRVGASLESLGGRHPVGRVGSPEEVADVVVLLARNRFMTGTAVVIDGGALARLSTE